MSEVENRTFDDLPEQTDLENGRYVAEFVGAEEVTDDPDGRTLYNVRIRATGVIESPMNDEDLVNAYPVRDRFWLHTVGAKRRGKNFFEKVMGMETAGQPYEVLFEALLGQPVGIEVERGVSQKGRTYVNVKNYFKVS